MRRQSRELALQILFQSEFAPEIDTDLFVQLFEPSFDSETIAYAKLLIHGVKQNKEAIDSTVQAHSRHWKLDRMANVDRNVLRVAVFEIKFMKPPLKEHMAINEAIEIAKKYGTTDSASFINGVLDQVSKST